MSTITKVKTVLVTLKTRDAEDWINDNISIPARQWQKDEDTGYLQFRIDSTFSAELIEEMEEDLKTGIDFDINEV
jgi:hypothetical protein